MNTSTTDLQTPTSPSQAITASTASTAATGITSITGTTAAPQLLGELDVHLVAEGRHRESARCLGAQPMTWQGQEGTRFAVWAPNAKSVSVIGEFNHWDPQLDVMQSLPEAGLWEIFIPNAKVGDLYKYAMTGPDGYRLPDKADPVARATEMPPGTASRIAPAQAFEWTDAAWMASRAERFSVANAPGAPIAVYEVQVGSWLRILEEGGRSLNWQELGDRLVPYACGMGFTHLELLPVMEHPFGGSWGYQPLSQFAPSARFGTPEEFAGFIDRCHQAGLGVILDWVPAHFPSDAHGLARFDGTALYEHEDPREGFHKDWNTLIYNFGRHEVRGFLIASALEWLERYHIDGLRVDAVASMLYRDYSRNAGEWLPNVHGGRENLEAVAFLKELNMTVHERCPGAMMIAQESTAWPGVTAAVDEGGLGFNFKWNMGWMHDSLHYMQRDPLFRSHHHHEMTFGLVYAFSERFMLPISHDEVVHGKGSLLKKMPGDDWHQLASLRAYFGWMWGHPGKKLIFMGCEIAQPTEWNHDASVTWDLLDDPRHRCMQRLVRDLNRAYQNHPALYALDSAPEGFEWLVGDDSANSVFALLRHAGEQHQSQHQHHQVLVVSNMTAVVRHNYRIGVPEGALLWREIINTDAQAYGGTGMGNGGEVPTQKIQSHGHSASVLLTLPPLSTLIFVQGN